MNEYIVIALMIIAIVAEIVLIIKARERNHFIYSIPIALIATMFDTFDTSNPYFIYILVIRFWIHYITAIITIKITDRMFENTFTYVLMFSTIYGLIIAIVQFLVKAILMKIL
jgi:hypothetical protein